VTAGAASPAGRYDLDELAQLALGLAEEAGALLADGQSGVRVANTKSTPTDIVTAMDRASEELIGQRLAAARPGDGLVAEEGSSRPAESGLEWVVDPLDGTVNYLYGLPMWAVSVAVRTTAERGDRALVGVVHAPKLGVTWTAIAGHGAYAGDPGIDGRRLRCSAAERLDRSLIGTGFAYDSARRGQQAAVLTRVLPQVRDIRRLGAAAVDLCLVAEGVLDGYFEQGLHIWDGAAGYLIAREAGAIVEGLDGAPPSQALTIAAPPAIFGQLTALLGQEPRADRA
jgi:myo-inositol-1(or 4)-monophosphatase